MGRTNKLTEGVFTSIVGSENEISQYDIFLKEETENSELKFFLEKYRVIIDRHKSDFQKMALLEEIIMQIRARDNMDEIKLSLVREYIYARCSFFRKEKTAKDIRVIVDNMEFYNNDFESLSKNETFMDKAKKKLIKAMDKEISENIANFKSLYKK